MRLVALFKQIKEQKALNSLTLGWQSVPSLSWPQGQLCGQSCHCPVQFECPQLTADIPNFDASLPANFSTHQVKGINFALSASRVTDQIPIAARHAGHPRIPSFR